VSDSRVACSNLVRLVQPDIWSCCRSGDELPRFSANFSIFCRLDRNFFGFWKEVFVERG
jgi:hypothetical protein